MKNALLLLLSGGCLLTAQNQLTVIPAGTPVSVRTIEAIDSKTADVNRQYAASLADPLMVGAVQLAPRNADVQLRVVENKQAGAVSGRASLVLQVAAIAINGQMVFVATGTTVRESGSQGKKAAKRGILGGLAGAGIGAIAGGGAGAAIGAGAGSAVGVASAALSGQQVKVKPETQLMFSLSQDVPLPGASSYAAMAPPAAASADPQGNPLVPAAAPPATSGQAQPSIYIVPRAAPPASTASADSTAPNQESARVPVQDGSSADRPTQSFDGWTVVLDRCERTANSVICFLTYTNTSGTRDFSLRVEPAINAIDSSFNVLEAKAVQLGANTWTEGATGMTMRTGAPVNGRIRFPGVAADVASFGRLKVMLRWPNGNGVAEFRNVPLVDVPQ